MDNKQVLKYIIGVHLHGEKDGTNDWNTALASGLDPITDIIPDYPHEVLSCRETTHHDTTYVDIAYITMHDASIHHYTPYMTMDELKHVVLDNENM